MNLHQLLKIEGREIEKNKGEHIFMQGDLDTSLYFIQSGLLKAYYTSDDGKEFIKSFIFPNDIICSLTSVYSKKECSFSLISLMPTILKKTSFEVLQEYSVKDHEIANSLIEVLLGFAMKKEKREYELLCLSAEERYSILVKTTPSLLNQVTQNDIARYLGVTPVGLSRIKKRTHNE